MADLSDRVDELVDGLEQAADDLVSDGLIAESDREVLLRACLVELVARLRALDGE